VEVKFIGAEELLAVLQSAESKGCKSEDGQPLVTLLDLRTEHHLDADTLTRPTITDIKTPCLTVFSLLDELQTPKIRRKIPTSGLVVTITETGNRDAFAVQYLSKFGYTNLKKLMFGMRGWIKKDYPVKIRSFPEEP
jgi:rhodanese-related sulfurtransferase